MILKRSQYDFSKLSSPSSKSESSDRDYLFSRNGNMKSACFTTFSIFGGFFYCFVFYIAPLIIWFSKLLISLLPPFFNFRPIWHPKTLFFLCSESHFEVPSFKISCIQHEAMSLHMWHGFNCGFGHIY